MFHVKHSPSTPCLQGLARLIKNSSEKYSLVKASYNVDYEGISSRFTFDTNQLSW